MLEAISDFAREPGCGKMVALAIMSHGDTKSNICGEDDEKPSTCTVQEVVNALCIPQLESTIKVVVTIIRQIFIISTLKRDIYCYY